ncbi:MAG: hypothetical protein KDE50_39050, partial [Caldilineaceae bacterium]|nr:hypothetical protein [Caldilineaceae bacterium]
MPNETLSANDLLLAEQNYLAQVAFQTNEDRSRVSTFYVASVGSLILAITSAQTQLVQSGPIYWGFVILFLALSLSGLLVLLQLVRLRQAWFETVLAMNQIKDYYTQYLPEEALDTAFMWTNASLPAKFKPWSISFLLTLQVAIIGGVTLGAALVFAGSATGISLWP